MVVQTLRAFGQWNGVRPALTRHPELDSGSVLTRHPELVEGSVTYEGMDPESSSG